MNTSLCLVDLSGSWNKGNSTFLYQLPQVAPMHSYALPSFSLLCTHTHPHPHPPTHTHSYTHSHTSCTHTLTHTHIHTLTHTNTTHTQTHTHTLTCRLAEQRGDLEKNIDQQQSEISKMEENISGLQPTLESIRKATLPLQESLGLPLDKRRTENETAQLLPP